MIEIRNYHKKVSWKKRFDRAMCYLVNPNSYLEISTHLLENIAHARAYNRFNHNINIDKMLKIVYDCFYGRCKSYLFEVVTEYDTETRYEKIVKCTFRSEYDELNDIVIVLKEGFIVTAWLNRKTDRHCTLDAGKYYQFKNKY